MLDAVAAALIEEPPSEDFDERMAVVMQCGGIDAVIAAMRVHPHVASIQRGGCEALGVICNTSRVCASAVLQADGIKLALGAIRTFPNDSNVLKMGYGALHPLLQETNAGVDEEAARKVLDRDHFIDLATQALRTFADGGTSEVRARDWRLWTTVMQALALYLQIEWVRYGDVAHTSKRRFGVARASGVIELAIFGLRKHADIVEETTQFSNKPDKEARYLLYDVLACACEVLDLFVYSQYLIRMEEARFAFRRSGRSSAQPRDAQSIADAGCIEYAVAALPGFVAFVEAHGTEATDMTYLVAEEFLQKVIEGFLSRLLKFGPAVGVRIRDPDSIITAMDAIKSLHWPGLSWIDPFDHDITIDAEFIRRVKNYATRIQQLLRGQLQVRQGYELDAFWPGP